MGLWYGVGPSVGLAGYGESSWPSCPLVCKYAGVGPRVCVFLCRPRVPSEVERFF